MANIKRRNFPGVITQIFDSSFSTTNTSRFLPGLIGVASKGAFDTPTAIASTQDFIRVFGQPITGQYLSTAVGLVAPFTNGAVVVRVGLKYKPLPTGSVSYAVTGINATGSFTTVGAPFVDSSVSTTPTGNFYVQVTQAGKNSLINAQVSSVQFGTVVQLAGGASLPDTYTNGEMRLSYYVNAASKAQGVLKGYTYSTVSGLGTVTGTKGSYTLAITTNPTNLNVGDLLRITQSGKYPTLEAYVLSVGPLISGNAVVQLQPTDDAERGYNAVALQDTYTAAVVERATGKTPAALIFAKTEGTWANTAAGTPITGLQVKVVPGSVAGTKKLLIYSDSTLQEVYDNLGFFTSPSGAVDFATTINTTFPSNYITIAMIGASIVPANTVDPWNLTATAPIIGSPTNSAAPLTEGSFANGFNGENAQANDYIGAYDPVNDISSGIQAFEDTDNVKVTTLCAPGITSVDASFLGVHTQLRDTALKTNSIGIIDVPYAFNSVPLTVWDAIDWHNGQGKFSSRGSFNTAYLGCFWNWFNMTDPITQTSILAPPTLAVLRAMAFTWIHDQPWYAAAGPNRGVIPEATGVSFPHVSNDAKEAMYSATNCINPILQTQGVVMVYGERTMLRVPPGSTDKLTAIHNLVLVEYCIQGLASIGRNKVFDPNDLTLLGQITLASTQFLDSVKNMRGIEAYSLVCDSSNNNSVTRNNRDVIVDFYVVPTDSVERIYISAIVNQSGAVLNSVTTS